MPYHRKSCFSCQQQTMSLLFAIAERGVPHEAIFHETIYSYRAIGRCSACGRAQLERHPHDCWGYHGDEDWEMYWWFLFDPAVTQPLLNLINHCPTPLDPYCKCDSHQQIRTASEYLHSPIPHVVYANDQTPFNQVTLSTESNKLTFKLVDSPETT